MLPVRGSAKNPTGLKDWVTTRGGPGCSSSYQEGQCLGCPGMFQLTYLQNGFRKSFSLIALESKKLMVRQKLSHVLDQDRKGTAEGKSKIIKKSRKKQKLDVQVCEYHFTSRKK